MITRSEVECRGPCRWRGRVILEHEERMSRVVIEEDYQTEEECRRVTLAKALDYGQRLKSPLDALAPRAR